MKKLFFLSLIVMALTVNAALAQNSEIVGLPMITSVSQMSSPYTHQHEGSLEEAIDGDPYTFWHSDWSDDSMEGGHYLQVELPEEMTTGTFVLYMQRRQTSNDHPSRMRITGSDNADFTNTTFEIEVDMPNAESGMESTSAEWTIEMPSSYLRFTAIDCNGQDGYGFRGYWHCAEIQIYQISEGKEWEEYIEAEIEELADVPALQAELKDAYDKYTALPEGSSDDAIKAEKANIAKVRDQIRSAQTAFAQLPTLIEQADSILATTTDDKLKAATDTAKSINATTSGSQAILDAYNTLQKIIAVYFALSVPRENWDFSQAQYNESGIEYYLDMNNGLADVNIAINDYPNLTELTIPETINVKGETYVIVCIRNCHTDSRRNKLKKLTLPASMLVLGNNAFWGLDSLEHINIPANLCEIEGWSFSDNNKLETIISEAVTPPALSNYPGIEFNRLKIQIPNGSFQSYQLANYWNEALLVGETLNELTLSLPESGELGYLVLDTVEYLAEINKLTITSGTLNNADWTVLKSMKNLIDLDLSACGNTIIPERQFQNSKLEKIKLPQGLTNIYSYTFDSSRRLESITLPSSCKTIEYAAFRHCNKLQEVYFNDGLERISQYAFGDCDLRRITIPSTVKTIGHQAFDGNRNLSEVNLSEGLEAIEDWAFYNTAVKTITLPSTLLTCRGYSFQNCDSLKDIHIHAILPPETDGNCPISGVDLSQVTLYVPAWSQMDYKMAPGWSEIFMIKPSDFLPQTIYINKDFTFRVDEEQAASYQPNIALVWSENWSRDNYGNDRYERGNLTINPSGKLNAKTFSMHYSPFEKFRRDQLLAWNWYNDTPYNANALIVEGEMRAEDVTITLMNRMDCWQFISFPFDVCMSDIVPLDSTTQWVIREYSGYNRANEELESTWIDLASDDMLVAGKGYIMHCHSESENSDRPVMFEIKPNTETVNRQNIFLATDRQTVLEEYLSEFAHNSSWNLIGNPYPCYYDTRYMNFTAPITVWNSAEGNYTAYSPIDDEYILTPGEAFFVQRPAEQENITFSAEGRQTDYHVRDINTTKARRMQDAERQVYNFILKSDKATDRTRIVLNESASMDYEMSCDASKFNAMNNKAIQLYSIQGGTRMSINERPLGNACVELGMVVGSDGIFTLSLNAKNGNTVIIEDLELGTRTELTAEKGYTFNAKAGEIRSRFYLHFTNSPETGIEDIETATSPDQPAYNAAGLRITDKQKGIVIKNGKKMLHK